MNSKMMESFRRHFLNVSLNRIIHRKARKYQKCTNIVSIQNCCDKFVYHEFYFGWKKNIMSINEHERSRLFKSF
jgi:hypothetical protein